MMNHVAGGERNDNAYTEQSHGAEDSLQRAEGT